MLVQPVELIQHGSAGLFQGRNAVEQIPETFEMVFHFPAAAHYIAAGRIEDTVAGAAGNILDLQNVNMGAGHLSVAYKEAGRRQEAKAAAHQVCIFSSTPSGFSGLAKAS